MKNILVSLIVALIVAFATASYISGQTVAPERKETAYDRVMRTGVLRCGYYVFAPALKIDANTGEKSGFAVDITGEMAKRLHLKVEWAEEVTFGTMMASLAAGRFDALCTPVWINAAQGREAEYSREMFYTPVMAISRVDDSRFDSDIKAADIADITIATMDGDITSSIALDDFFNAKTISIPNNSSLAQLFMNVKDKKADLTFVDMNAFRQFDQANPGQLKVVTPGKPTRIFPFAMAVKKGEFELQSLFNNTLTEMLYSGYIEKTVRRHELFPDSFLYIDTPYRK